MYGTAGQPFPRHIRLAENQRTRIQAAIKRASKTARANVQALDRELLVQLEQVYRNAVADIGGYLQSRAGDDNTIRLEVMRSLLDQSQARLNFLEAERNGLLDEGLRQAAGFGVQPFTGVPEIGASLVQVADDAVRFVTQFVADDGLQLSDRLWAIDNHARDVVRSEIQRAVVQGHSASEAARDLLARGLGVPPELASKMTAAQWDKIAREIDNGLLTGEGSAYSNARRVMRTEINRAHGEAYQAAAFDHPDVIGTRFLLSPNHPRTDICDMHARVNRYGLGPGVYPKDKNPWPAHPNTLSFTEVVFSDEVTEEDKSGKIDRIEWLKGQTAATQAGILGDRKREALLRGLLKEQQINTPWRVLKKRYQRRGYDPDNWATDIVNPPEQVNPVPPAKPNIQFQPARTPKEASQWAMDNNLADFADYTGSSAEVANAWNRSVYEHVTEFPQIRKNLQFIGTVQARAKHWRRQAIDRYINEIRLQNPGLDNDLARKFAERMVKKPRTPGNVWAYSYSSGMHSNGVAVNAKWAKDPALLKESLATSMEAGYHPIGSDTIKSIIDHELGHQLDSLLRLRTDPTVIQSYKKWLKDDPDGALLSRYARTDIAEFIAEAWGEYRNAEQPRELSLTIGRLIQQKYQEQFSG